MDDGKKKRSARTAALTFFYAHRIGCIAAAALVLICAVLAVLKPPMKRLREQIPQEFIETCGGKYGQAETNLLVVGSVRGRNVNSGEAYTFIGFAGKIFTADVDTALKEEMGLLETKAEQAERSVKSKEARYKRTGNAADQPTQADKDALAAAKAALKTPEAKAKSSQLARQSFKKSAADIILWIPSLIDGAKITISLTILSVLVGIFLSIFLALGKISKFKPLSRLCSAYIFFFRGTPLLMQLFFVYYGLPYINPEFALDKFPAAFAAFTLNSAAYCAEIIRAAIQSIDKGQFEASHALGLNYGKTMRLIIIPQSVRRLIPPIANEFIMVLKDASLVSVIALTDLTQATRAISSSNASVLVYIPAMVIYLIITGFFTFIFNRLEKRFSIHL